VDESNESVHIFKEERDSLHFGKEEINTMGGSERDQPPSKNLAETAVAMRGHVVGLGGERGRRGLKCRDTGRADEGEHRE
jgi:hypothetical protein